MPWFNVDDGFAFHRKAVRAGNAAIGLWTRAGSWCAGELTDGFVPDHMIRAMRGTAIQTQRLVDAGLWVRDDVRGGFQFHEWSESGRNPTRKEVERRREEAAKRKQKSRGNQHGKSEKSQVGESGHSVTDAGVTAGVTGGRHAPTPLHSTPITEEKTSSSSPRRPEPPREDVDELCRRLLGKVQANGGRASITQAWRKEARLLLDADERPLEQALRLIDWATDHPFWKANILSMPTFRRQYTQLLLKARAEHQQGTPASAATAAGSTGSKRVDKAMGFLAPNDPLRARLASHKPVLLSGEQYEIEGGRSA